MTKVYGTGNCEWREGERITESGKHIIDDCFNKPVVDRKEGIDGHDEREDKTFLEVEVEAREDSTRFEV